MAAEYIEARLLNQVKSAGLPEPYSQHRFHPERNWAFNYAWPERLLAVEVDAGPLIVGRHNRWKAYENDAEKYNEASLLGWRVLHVTGAMVNDGRALAFVKRALQNERTEP